MLAFNLPVFEKLDFPLDEYAILEKASRPFEKIHPGLLLKVEG